MSAISEVKANWQEVKEFINEIKNESQCPSCANLPIEMRVKPFCHCITSTQWNPRLGECNPSEFEQLFKGHVNRFHNVGGSVFKIGLKVKEIYRSANLAGSTEALNELVRLRNVKTIINLHHSGRFDTKSWIEGESQMFYRIGGTNYEYISDFDYRFSNQKEKSEVFRKIAHIIFTIKQYEGNVLIHCGGGEHRTGLVYGVLQKCYQKIPLETIIEEYKSHSCWTTDDSPKGYNEKNIEIIRDFPVELVLTQDPPDI